MYINDLQYSSNILHFILYADDSNLFISGNDIKNTCAILNNELQSVNKWFLANKLKLNVDKTSCMVFKTKNKNINLNDVNLHIAGINVPIVHSTKFLGVTLDDHLTWNHHVDVVCSKISRAIGAINKISAIVPSNVLLDLYFTMILPHLMYCNIVWGNCAKYLLNRIHILQKRAIRIISKSHPLTHTDPLFEKFNLLTIYEINKFCTCTFTYSYINDLLPKFLDDCFIENNSRNTYNTRQSNLLYIPYYKYNVSRRTIRYTGPLLWNVIPEYIKYADSLSSFKDNYKNFLLNH